MKRSPMPDRKAPMQRSQPPVVTIKRRRFRLNRPLMDVKLRDYVYERSKGCCDLCGQPAREARWECHHRKLRSQGGPDDATNLIVLHHLCHDRVHDQPEWSYAEGFLVPSWANPAEWPVHRHESRWQQPTSTGWVGSSPTESQLSQGEAA